MTVKGNHPVELSRLTDVEWNGGTLRSNRVTNDKSPETVIRQSTERFDLTN